MERKKLLLMIGAIAIALFAGFLARNVFSQAAQPQAGAARASEQGPKVLVAQRTLPAGTIVTADALTFQPWPEDLVQDAYFLSGKADVPALLGTVVRFPVTAGEPVTRGSLVAPGDRGFLAAALGPGMRAVTVSVSAQAGVAGFVFPGDRVDLVLTQTVTGADNQSLRASETIVRNLRVLATDQSASNEVVDGKTVVRAFKTVTLEVTPRIAEKVAVAQAVGTLSLSLRALAGSGPDLDQAVAAGDVEIPEGVSDDEEERLLRAAASRPQDSAGTYATGGDVSRFQRRTLPPMRSRPNPDPMPQTIVQPVVAAPAAAMDGSPARPAGPTVRVTRGKATTIVAVEGR